MIIAKIDDERFRHLVSKMPLIAFQRLEFGYAVAAPDEAYYAPVSHPGGGNLPPEFLSDLGSSFLKRMSKPALRTLRPTTKPIPTAALVAHLRQAYGEAFEAMQHFDQLPGDHPTVVESECQIVILAIEENERPDFKDAMISAKREAMSDTLDIVIEHAEAARELCEVGDDKPAVLKMHLMQLTTAVKTCLEMLLKP